MIWTQAFDCLLTADINAITNMRRLLITEELQWHVLPSMLDRIVYVHMNITWRNFGFLNTIGIFDSLYLLTLQRLWLHEYCRHQPSDKAFRN